jgi:hypothetical protein
VCINRMACFSLFISFFSRTRCLRLSLSLSTTTTMNFFCFVFIFLVADDDDLVFIIVSPHPKLFRQSNDSH